MGISESFFSDSSVEPDYLSKQIERRKGNKKKAHSDSLPRRGPAPVEEVDSRVPTEDLAFSPVPFS